MLWKFWLQYKLIFFDLPFERPLLFPVFGSTHNINWSFKIKNKYIGCIIWSTSTLKYPMQVNQYTVFLRVSRYLDSFLAFSLGSAICIHSCLYLVPWFLSVFCLEAYDCFWKLNSNVCLCWTPPWWHVVVIIMIGIFDHYLTIEEEFLIFCTVPCGLYS